jgi:hypothetical protein
VPPGFEALAGTDSFSAKTLLGKLTVNIRKLTKLLRPYLLTKNFKKFSDILYSFSW